MEQCIDLLEYQEALEDKTKLENQEVISQIEQDIENAGD